MTMAGPVQAGPTTRSSGFTCSNRPPFAKQPDLYCACASELAGVAIKRNIASTGRSFLSSAHGFDRLDRRVDPALGSWLKDIKDTAVGGSGFARWQAKTVVRNLGSEKFERFRCVSLDCVNPAPPSLSFR